MRLWILTACAGGIIGLYERERSDVVRPPPPAPSHWSPQVRVRLAPQALTELAHGALDAGLLQWKRTERRTLPLGIELEITPTARVKRLDLKMDPSCDSCLAMNARLTGKAQWTAGPMSGALPFTASFAGTIRFQVSPDAEGWRVHGRLTRIDTLHIRLENTEKIDLSDALRGWAKEAVKQTPPMVLGTIGGGELPLRAVRLGQSGGALEIRGLMDSSHAVSVAQANTPLPDGWEIRVHQDTALALARRSAFERGPLEHDIAIDPRSLRVDGKRFTLGLRLWRLTGRGWWRDYTVTGRFGVIKDRIRLVPREATEGEKSPGAGLVDPIAALAEGRILEAVEDGLRQQLPASKGGEVGQMRWKVHVTDVKGDEEVLVVRGAVATR